MEETQARREYLEKCFAQAGYRLTPLQVQRFCTYGVELEKWNRTMHLTAFRTWEAVVQKLFLASLDFGKGFVPRPGLRVLDLGSGAGIPGLPLKIVYPELEVTLVERSQKKGIFLHHLCRVLALSDVTCLIRDAADLAQEGRHREHYEVVVSRGVGSIRLLLELAFPLLQPQGILLLEKGEKYRVELEEAQQVLQGHGGRWCDPLPLPSMGGERWLIGVQKGALPSGERPNGDEPRAAFRKH